MESAGISQAGHFNQNLPVLTIRGVSDHADGTKSRTDGQGWQGIAATTAADFAAAVVAAIAGESVAEAGTLVSQGIRWRTLEEAVDVRWRSDFPRNPHVQERAALEVHLLSSHRVEARVLAELPERLVEAGRSHGLFTSTEELRIETVGHSVGAHTVEYKTGPSGLMVFRDGQTSAWTPLPSDDLGAVFDNEDVADRVDRLLAALLAIPLPRGGEIFPAIALQPAISVTADSVRAMPRNRASGMWRTQEVRVNPEDAVSYEDVIDHRYDVAAELTARLIAESPVNHY
jgi:hypothetical protein